MSVPHSISHTLTRAALAAIALPFLVASTQPEARTEFQASDRVSTITIDGRTTLVEVAPDGPNSVIVNAAVADALDKRGSLLRGEHRIGRMAIKAQTNTARIDFGDGNRVKNRIFWFERDWNSIGEGRIGPGLIPSDEVTFRLREAQPGERTITLPLIAHRRAGLRTELVVDGVTVPMVFTFDRPQTMITASTGALLASRYDGKMVGEPFPMGLEMGFHRPVRSMAFNEDVFVGRLQLKDIVVRTTDMGSTSAIPDDQQDPNEIVVTGKGKRPAVHGIFVGTESLGHCSSLTFDKPAKEIRLSCKD